MGAQTEMSSKPALVAFIILALIGVSSSNIYAGPFSEAVQSDSYSGVDNGIPTARDKNDGSPDIYEAINRILGKSYTTNSEVDTYSIEPHGQWEGINGNIIFIGSTAWNSNRIGYYSDIGAGTLKNNLMGPYSGFGFSGDGSYSQPYPAANFIVNPPGRFGWFLSNEQYYYYSEPNLNPAGIDHMMTFDLKEASGKKIYVDYGSGPVEIMLNHPYLIVWEDSYWGGSTLGDDDYDDMMYLVDIVNPFPFPYIRQRGDTDNNFDGTCACGATSAVMIAAYHDRLPPKSITISQKCEPGHITDYGWYVAPYNQDTHTPVNEGYKQYNFAFDISFTGISNCEIDPVSGVYGFIHYTPDDVCKNNPAACAVAKPYYARNYFWKHGLFSKVITNPTEISIKKEIDRGNPVWASTNVWDGWGHIIVIKVYTATKYIVADPWVYASVQGSDCTDGSNKPYSWEEMGSCVDSQGVLLNRIPEGDCKSPNHWVSGPKWIVIADPIAVGDRVIVTSGGDKRPVRTCPSQKCPVIASPKSAGDTGTIVEETTQGLPFSGYPFWNSDDLSSTDFHTWVKIRWDKDGAEGWSAIGNDCGSRLGCTDSDLWIEKIDKAWVNLPRTGQTGCYDSSGNVIGCARTGQDGDTMRASLSWPNPRFTDPDGKLPITGSVVADQLTGLMWTRNANLAGSYKTWQEALDYVAAMNAGLQQSFGYTDWRLPNINELESLTHAGEQSVSSWLSSQGFSNVQSGRYWSSTTDPSYLGGTNAWDLNLLSGGLSGDYIEKQSKFSPSYVWPVRSSQFGSMVGANVWKTGQKISYAPGDDGDIQVGISWPSPRFMDHEDGTVTDNLTGLMWSKDANPPGPVQCNAVGLGWENALAHVACLNTAYYLGYSDWRLPNRKEILSLIDRSKYDPAVGHPFINLGNLWSSTTNAWNPAAVWGFNISDGSAQYYGKTSWNLGIWPVRGVTQTPFQQVVYVSKDGLCGGSSPCVNAIQNGIVAATVPTVINITQETYDENVILDFDQVISLRGGWNTNFTSNSSPTTIDGSITITNGTMVLENIILQ